MKKVTRDDYVFDIDVEKAESLYADAPRVFDSLSGYLPELTQFLASLGIDIEKPVKYNLMEYDPSDLYDLLYTTFGTFTTQTGYELDFYGEDKTVSVVVFKNDTKRKGSVQDDVIHVEVFGIMFNRS